MNNKKKKQFKERKDLQIKERFINSNKNTRKNKLYNL